MVLVRDRDPRPARGGRSARTATGELDWARQLLHLLDKTMLVLMDRGFDAGDFLAEVAGTGAQFLVRLNASRRPRSCAACPTGPSPSVIGGVKVRIIAAEVTVTCHDGTSYGGWYRLATTLLDHRAFPAARLMRPLPRALGATRSRLERVELAEGGPIHVGDVVPGPVCKDRPRPGVRCG